MLEPDNLATIPGICTRVSEALSMHLGITRLPNRLVQVQTGRGEYSVMVCITLAWGDFYAMVYFYIILLCCNSHWYYHEVFLCNTIFLYYFVKLYFTLVLSWGIFMQWYISIFWCMSWYLVYVLWVYNECWVFIEVGDVGFILKQESVG